MTVVCQSQHVPLPKASAYSLRAVIIIDIYAMQFVNQ